MSCTHDRDTVILEPLGALPCPEGRHTMLMLLGCRQCGVAVPFPEYNFRLLTAVAQDHLREIATAAGYAWDLDRFPLASGDGLHPHDGMTH